MFVMLSVRTTSVCERHNKVTPTPTQTTSTKTANTDIVIATTTRRKDSKTLSKQTTPKNPNTITSSLTSTFDNILVNKHSFEKIFTKSVSFDKNINQSNSSLTQPNNLKEPPVHQVKY